MIKKMFFLIILTFTTLCIQHTHCMQNARTSQMALAIYGKKTKSYKIIIIDTKEMKIIKKIKTDSKIYSMAYDPQNPEVLTYSQKNKIKIRNFFNRTIWKDISLKKEPCVFDIQYLPHSSKEIIFFTKYNKIKKLNIETEELCTIVPEEFFTTYPYNTDTNLKITKLHANPHNPDQIAFITNEKKAHLYNIQTKKLYSIHNKMRTSMQYNPWNPHEIAIICGEHYTLFNFQNDTWTKKDIFIPTTNTYNKKNVCTFIPFKYNPCKPYHIATLFCRNIKLYDTGRKPTLELKTIILYDLFPYDIRLGNNDLSNIRSVKRKGSYSLVDIFFTSEKPNKLIAIFYNQETKTLKLQSYCPYSGLSEKNLIIKNCILHCIAPPAQIPKTLHPKDPDEQERTEFAKKIIMQDEDQDDQEEYDIQRINVNIFGTRKFSVSKGFLI